MRTRVLWSGRRVKARVSRLVLFVWDPHVSLETKAFGPFQIVINVICSRSCRFTRLFLLSCRVFNSKPPF